MLLAECPSPNDHRAQGALGRNGIASGHAALLKAPTFSWNGYFPRFARPVQLYDRRGSWGNPPSGISAPPRPPPGPGRAGRFGGWGVSSSPAQDDLHGSYVFLPPAAYPTAQFVSLFILVVMNHLVAVDGVSLVSKRLSYEKTFSQSIIFLFLSPSHPCL